MEEETVSSSLVTFTVIQILVGVFLFIALLNGQRDLVMLTLSVLFLVGGARLWARMSQANLQCHLTVDKHRVFPDEKLVLTISAENAKLLPIWLEIKIPIGLLRGASDNRVVSMTGGLLWYQRTKSQWELSAERRGVYSIGSMDILSGDLFSFFSRRTQSKATHSIIVYPRIVPLKHFALPRRDFFGVPGIASPVPDPIYILGTRDYQTGQPSKYIHWKASARHNHLQEKVFESTVQEKILLAVNVDSFARAEAEDDFERALQVVASLAARLDRQGHSVGLIVNGSVIGGGLPSVPIARNNNQISSILELLARLEMKSEMDFADVLHSRLAETWGVTCICFSNKVDGVFSANKFFVHRRIPTMFVVNETRLGVDKSEFGLGGKVYRLQDLWAERATSR